MSIIHGNGKVLAGCHQGLRAYRIDDISILIPKNVFCSDLKQT